MSDKVEIKSANGESARANGGGTVDVETLVKGKRLKKSLTNVLYVPSWLLVTRTRQASLFQGLNHVQLRSMDNRSWLVHV
jgi:hypothetical protein